MNIPAGNIGNALHSVAPEHVVAITNEIYDQTMSLYQDEINQLAVSNSVDLSQSVAEKFASQSAGSDSVPVYMVTGSPIAVTRINLGAITASAGFRGDLAGTAKIAVKLVNTTSGSTSVPVYISGGVPKAVTGINLANISASTGFRGNLTGDVTGSRVSASVQIYAPNISGSNIIVTNLTASTIQGTVVGTSSHAISASHVPFTQLTESGYYLTASVGSVTRTVAINSASYANKAHSLVVATSGSTSVPVYISGGVPKVITDLSVNSITASRVSASVQVYAPIVTGKTGSFTKTVTTYLTASNIEINGGLDMKSGDFYLSGAGDYNGSNKNDAETVQEVLKRQEAALTALAAGAKVTLSPSPSTIYKNTATTVTLTGTLSNVTPTSMTIYDGTTVVATTQSNARVQGSTSVNISSNTKSFKCEAIYMGVALVTTATINARYPILYGFATTYSGVTKKVTATTSAVRTYSDKSTANGQHLYIMVPTDITDVSQFSMGGAPFAMNAVTSQTVNGIAYKVHESAVAYNANTTVTVAAS